MSNRLFLGMEPEELTSSTLTPEQIQQEQDSHYMKDTAPVDWVQLDADTAPILEKVVQGVYDGTANENSGARTSIRETCVSGDGLAGASTGEYAKMQGHL